MKKLLVLSASVASLTASMAAAGGWQASSLDSSFMYAEGTFGELSFGKVTPNIKAATAMDFSNSVNDSGRKVVKDETRMSLSFKTDVGPLSVGLTSYRYGSIQLDGGVTEAPGGTWVPNASATIDTLALMGKWAATENIDVLFGITNNTVQNSTVNTIMGQYDISSATAQRPIIGVAYSLPDIALRIEAQYMPKTKLTASTTFTESSYGAPAVGGFGMPAISYGDVVAASSVNPAITGLVQGYQTALQSGIPATIAGFLATDIGGGVTAKQALTATSAATSSVSDFNAEVGIPETLRVNFQTGIAKDTLLFGSIEHTKWGNAQISVPTGNAATAIETEFSNTTSYSIGIGRRLNEQWSISATYNKEPGTSSQSSSLFTVNNGSEGLTLGARYTQGNMVVSGGVNYTRVGDVDIVTDGGTTLATYSGNTVMGVGVKLGFTF